MKARRIPAWRSMLSLLMFCSALAGCATGSLSPDAQQQVVGKTYVITGASSGIGRGVAEQLAGLKANLVLAARRGDVLQQVAAEASSAGAAVLVVPADVSKPEDIERLSAEALSRFGRIDVWINNAGVGAIGRFEDIPMADHARIIDVNLKGVIYGSHEALRQFMTQGYGTLINIGSIESEVPLAYQASYAASKAGVLSLGRTLNEEIRLSGVDNIAVATVMPWATDTPFFTHAANYSGGTPRMAAMDDPQKVVDAIVRISVYPREEIAVGWKGKGAYASHRIFPDLTERVSGNISHKLQVERAPPAPATDGNLFVPMEQGRGVSGDHRERMKRENAEMKETGQ